MGLLSVGNLLRAELRRQGITPTVAQAVEFALVLWTTAYRYFPTQESLLLELSVTGQAPLDRT